ncbi:MAG: ABC transporter substrate-binding protein [Caldimonas sp.]
MLRNVALGLGWPLVFGLQAAQRVWRIGFLGGGPRPSNGLVPEALRQALRDLGYVEGKNVVYSGRWSESRSQRLPGLADELINLKPDVIVTFVGKAGVAAKNATSTVPIVFVGDGDAIGVGLIASLSRPGGNVTGITDQANELSAKRLELLKEAIPAVKRVAVLWNADDLGMTLRYQQIQKAAAVLRLTVEPLGVREPEDFNSAFSSMDKERPDALLLVTDSFTDLSRKRVLDFAATHGIPAMYERGNLVREGGLMSYGPNFDDMFRRAATYVDKILKGTRPGDLPVEQPTRYYLLVNVNTAKSLGLTIPNSVLLRADEIVR